MMANIDLSELLNAPSPKSLLAFMLALALSVSFAVVVKWIHQYYFLNKGTENGDVSHSLLLIAPAVTAIFLVIQFSLPLSLGLLGALSFVRFRTPIKDAEEIGFILIVIANSLSCAVFRYEVALILSLTLGVVAVMRSRLLLFSRFFKGRRSCDLFVTSKAGVQENILALLSEATQLHALKSELISISQGEESISYHLKISKPELNQSVLEKVSQSLKQIASVSKVNLILNATS